MEQDVTYLREIYDEEIGNVSVLKIKLLLSRTIKYLSANVLHGNWNG